MNFILKLEAYSSNFIKLRVTCACHNLFDKIYFIVFFIGVVTQLKNFSLNFNLAYKYYPFNFPSIKKIYENFIIIMNN